MDLLLPEKPVAMPDDNNSEDQPSKLKTEVRATDSLANNSPDFEMSEKNFETFVVVVVVVAEELEVEAEDID